MKSQYHQDLQLNCEANPNTPLYMLLPKTNKVLKGQKVAATFNVDNGAGYKKKIKIIITK
jgi:hypothetical protein